MAYGYPIYFTERPKNRVIRWDPDGGDVEIVAGEPADGDPAQKLRDPYGLAIGSDGDLLVADKLKHRVCRLREGRLERVATRDADGHRAPPVESTLLCPTGLYIEDGGTLLCAYSDDHTIYRIHPDGRLELLLGIPFGRRYLRQMCREVVPPEEIAETPLFGPTSVVKRSDGTLYFIERGYQVVREYHPKRGLRCLFPLALWRKFVLEFSKPATDGNMDEYHPAHPTALALDAEENLYFADAMHRCVWRFDLEKRRMRCVVEVPAEAGPYGGPAALAFGPDGTAWVVDGRGGRVQGYRATKRAAWSPEGPSLTEIRGERLAFGEGGTGLVCGRAVPGRPARKRASSRRSKVRV